MAGKDVILPAFPVDESGVPEGGKRNGNPNVMKDSVSNWFSPRRLMAGGFAAAILLGTLLLWMPQASATGTRLSFLDALFTSTSATCVTGLSVIDIGSQLSLFGQLVLLFLIQLGGLGITTLSTFLLVIAGRRLSVKSEFVLMDAYGIKKVAGLRSLLIWTIGFTFIFEAIGSILLTIRYLHPEAGFAPMKLLPAIYYSVFHCVSAFCNAGFALYPDSLVRFHEDSIFLGILGVLIVAGSLGFIVMYNLITIKFWRRDLKTRGKLSLHTKIVLLGTVVLIAVGFFFTLAMEWDDALSGMSWEGKLICSFFHSVAPRTAGFNVVPMDKLTEGSRLFTMFLMFVGGSPASSAGGVKTTTLIILLVTVVAMCRNKNDTIIFSRTISNNVVRESMVIFILMWSIISIAYLALVCTEAPIKGDESSRLLFEVVSATATSGLSINQTPLLSSAGRLVIIACMYIGRLGPLAIALTVGGSDEPQRIHYPEEEIVVG